MKTRKILKTEHFKRVETCFELLVIGLTVPQIISLVKSDKRYLWGVTDNQVRKYIQYGKAMLIEQQKELQADLLQTVANRLNYHYQQLALGGQHYKAILALSALADRTIGKPAQRIDVTHVDTQPRTMIQINGENVNFDVTLPVNEPVKAIEAPKEKELPWYATAAEPIPTTANPTGTTQGEKRSKKKGTKKGTNL